MLLLLLLLLLVLRGILDLASSCFRVTALIRSSKLAKDDMRYLHFMRYACFSASHALEQHARHMSGGLPPGTGALS